MSKLQAGYQSVFTLLLGLHCRAKFQSRDWFGGDIGCWLKCVIGSWLDCEICCWLECVICCWQLCEIGGRQVG